MPEDIQQKTLIDRMRTIAIALKWTPISVDTSGATIKMTIESPRTGGTPTPIVTEAPITVTVIPKVKAEACPEECMNWIEMLFEGLDKLATAADPKIVIDIRDNALNEVYAIANAWKESGYKAAQEKKLRE